MSGKRGVRLAVLTIALAVAVFGSMPDCALAGRGAPAVTLPGPNCVWFFDWPSSGGDDANNGDGEDEWTGPGPDPDDDPDGPEWGMYWWP
jgi:hypothetical protein